MKPCSRVPCQKCENCLKKDCGKCKSCKHNTKSHASGSTGKAASKSPAKTPSQAEEKICEERACLQLQLPESAICSICKGHQKGKQLMECTSCAKISHPKCVKSTISGVFKSEENSYWVCPKCCREQCTAFCDDPCPYSGKHHEMLVEMLKTNNHNVNDDRSRLKLFKSSVEKYVKKGWNCDGESVPDESPKLRYPIMHLTVMFGKTQALDWLLQQGFQPLHTCKDQQPDPGSPLHLAVTGLKDGAKNLKGGKDGLVKLFAQIADLFLIHSPHSFKYKHPQSQDSFLHFLARKCLEKKDLAKEYLLATLQKLKEYQGKVKTANVKEVLCAKNAEGNTFLHLVVQDNSLHDVVKHLASNFGEEFKVMSATKNKADDTPREIAAEKRCIKICHALGAPEELLQIIAQENTTDGEDEKKFIPNIDKETETKRKQSESEKSDTVPKRRRISETKEQTNSSSTTKTQSDISTQTKKKVVDPNQSKKQSVYSRQSEKQINNAKQTEQSSDNKRSSESSSHSKKQSKKSSDIKSSSDNSSHSKKETKESSDIKKSDNSSHSKKQTEKQSDTKSKRSLDTSSYSKKETEQSSDSKGASNNSPHSKKQIEKSSDTNSKRSSDTSTYSKRQTEQSSNSKKASNNPSHAKIQTIHEMKEAESSSQGKRFLDSSSQNKEQEDQASFVKGHPDVSSQRKDASDSEESKESSEQSVQGTNRTDYSNQKKQSDKLSHGNNDETCKQSRKSLDKSCQIKKEFDNSSQDMKLADQPSQSKEDDDSDNVSRMDVDDNLGDMDVLDDVTSHAKEGTEDDRAVCSQSTPTTSKDITRGGSSTQTTNTHTVFCYEECVARHSRVLQVLHKCNNSPHNTCNNIPHFMQVLDEYLHKEGRSAAHRPIPDTVKEFRHPVVHWASVLGKYQLLNYLAKRKDFNLSVSNPLSDNETAIHRTLLFLEEALTRADPAVSMERIFTHFSKVVDVFAREAPVVFGKQNVDGDTPFHLVAKAIMEVGQIRQLQCYARFFKIMLQKVTCIAENSRLQFEKVKEMMCKTNSEGETFLHILTCRVGIGHELCGFTLEVLPEEILVRLKKIETRYGKSASSIATDLGSYKLAAHLSHEMSPRKLSIASDASVQSPGASRAERAARRQDIKMAQWFEENRSSEEGESQNDTVENQFLPIDEGESEVMSPVFSPQGKSSNKRKLTLDNLSDLTPRARTKKQVFSFSPSHDRSSPISDSSGEEWSPGGLDSAEEEESYAPAEFGEIVAPPENQEMDIPEEHEETEPEETNMPIDQTESRDLSTKSDDLMHSSAVVDSGSEAAASSSVEVLKREKHDDSYEYSVSRGSAELKKEKEYDAGASGESQVTSTSPRVQDAITKSSGSTTPTSSRRSGKTVDSKSISKQSSAGQSSDTSLESTPSQSSTKTLPAKSVKRNASGSTSQATPSAARAKACIISGIMRSPHTPLVKQSIIRSLQSQFRSTLENAKKSLKDEEEQLQAIRTRCVDAEEKKRNLLQQITALDKTIVEAMEEEKNCQDLCKTKKEECKQFEMELEKCEASLQELEASM